MNFTQSFEEFSKGLSSMDLALYAGVGLVVWVLFKDKLSPVKKTVLDLIDHLKGSVPHSLTPPTTPSSKGVFFDLVVSWKQTRDLAEKSGCKKAVEVADQMFPYLSPQICDNTENSNA